MLNDKNCNLCEGEFQGLSFKITKPGDFGNCPEFTLNAKSIGKIVEAILIARLQKNYSNNYFFWRTQGPPLHLGPFLRCIGGRRGGTPYSICNKFVFGRMQYAPTNQTSHLTHPFYKLQFIINRRNL